MPTLVLGLHAVDEVRAQLPVEASGLAGALLGLLFVLACLPGDQLALAEHVEPRR